MPMYYFKLLGGVGDRAEADLDIQFELTVADVKDLVRKAFRMIPSIEVEFMVGGRKLSDTQKWGMSDAKPGHKSPVLVIGHRND